MFYAFFGGLEGEGGGPFTANVLSNRKYLPRKTYMLPLN